MRYKKKHSLSSFRMYFKAKVKPVSFRSTIRTFPKAPFPTTRRSRKWFKFTIGTRNSSAKRPVRLDRMQACSFRLLDLWSWYSYPRPRRILVSPECYPLAQLFLFPILSRFARKISSKKASRLSASAHSMGLWRPGKR